MTEEQKVKLVEWLKAQAYNSHDYDVGHYLRLEEMLEYLPEVLERILKGEELGW